jgi:hypothetical protein
MKLLFKLLIIVSSLAVHSKNEANNWYFGYNAVILFNTGSPVALDDGLLLIRWDKFYFG